MNKALMYKVLTLCSLGFLAFALSCGHPQTLESITLNPTSAGENISGGGVAPIKFTAYGSFIHPSKTVDISNQVTWSSNASWLATVDNTGNVTPTGAGCGDAIITATAGKNVVGPGSSNEVVYASATFTVTNTTSSNPACGGQAEPTLTVDILGNGAGLVTSVPAGINCTTPGCNANFPAGTSVTLTATPTGASTFGGWQNCTTTTGTACTIIVNANTTVDVSFN